MGDSDKLPKIHDDPDTGKRYVKIDGKRIWLGKGVTEKNLLKFLKKLRKSTKKKGTKKSTTKKKSTKKKKGTVRFVKERKFGENEAKSFLGNPALNPAFNLAALTSQSRSQPADTKELDALAKKFDKLLESKKDDQLIVPGKKDEEQFIDFEGMKVTRNDLMRVSKDLHREREKIQKEKEEAKKKSEEARRKSEEAEKKNKELQEKSKKLVELNEEISKYKQEMEEKKAELINAREIALDELRGKRTRSAFLKIKAREFDIKGTRIDELIEPVIHQIILSQRKVKDPHLREVALLSNNVVRIRNELKKSQKKYDELKPKPELKSQRDILEEIQNEQKKEDESLSLDELFTQQLPKDKRPLSIVLEEEEMPELEDITAQGVPPAEEGVVPSEEDVSQPADILSPLSEVRDYTDRIRNMNDNHDILVNQLKNLEENHRINQQSIGRLIERNPEQGSIMLEKANEKYDLEKNKLLHQIYQMEEQMETNMVGDGRRQRDLGLSTTQVNDLMKGYPDYLGCIGSDQIREFQIKPQSMFGFVMNTDPSYKAGEHWIAVFVDGRMRGSHSIEYFDSLADDPTRQVFNDLKELGRRVQSPPLLFKYNRIADQSNESSNCGFFATKFLMDRFNGKSFTEASGYNKRSPEGEKMIEDWKKKLGVTKFRYIEEQNGEGFRDVIKKGYDYVKKGYESVKERVKEVMQGLRKHASPSIRSWLEKNGDKEIVELKICRKPIFSVIEKLANLLSNGKWEENKEKLSYDKLMHLFALFKLEDGGVFRIEKNHVVEIKSDNWNTGKDTEEMSYQLTTNLTMRILLEGAEKKVGADKLWIYDARTQNCQYFMKWLLGNRIGWTPDVEKFVMQDAEKVLEGMGVLGKVAKVVTDIAGVADVALNGAGKRRGRGGRR